ncbi:MAG: FAD-binding oxidoreductase [Solirubrobacterales bacterium]
MLSTGAPAYEENRGAFNLLLDQRPAAIALPASAAEVSEAIAAAKSRGLRVATQRTGHGADPLRSLEQALLIRTAGLTEVEIDAEARSARVGAGALWSDLVPSASEQGLAGLHGSTGTVGITGYMLGGGLGWYGRKHGLGCNSVTAVELVSADGEARRVDRENEPELFWALRGGGGDFGVVTALEFDLLPVAEVFAGALFFPLERAGETLGAWLEWIAGVPDEVTSVGRVMAFPPFPEIPEPLRGNSFAVVEAVHLGDEESGSELLAPLRGLEPAIDTFAAQPPAGISELHMDPPEPGPALGDGMLLGELDAAALEAWLAVVGPGTDSPLVSVELRHIGGALGRSEAGCGVLGSVPGSFLQFAIGAVPEPALREPVLGRIAELAATMAPWSAGRYRSFSMTPVAVSEVLPAESCERLRAVKAEYDPEGLFLSNQPLSG